jgi:hypothetical protein
MCTPILIGVATGLISAVQSIAGYQAQSQAASASEKAYQEQRNLNQEAANRAYQQTQLKMKGEMEKASQQAEQGLVRRLQAQGTTLAAGRTGQSIGGLLADAERVEGKDLGTLGMNLAYAQQDYFFGMENIYTQQKNANIQAASQRTAKPSVGGLVLGLAGSVVSGAQTAMALKAPAGGGGGGGKGGAGGGRGSGSYGGGGSSYSPPLTGVPDYSGAFKKK